MSFDCLLPISDRKMDFSGAGGGNLGSGRSCVSIDVVSGKAGRVGSVADFSGGVGADGMVAVEPLLTLSFSEGGRELRESERNCIAVGWSTEFFLWPGTRCCELPGSSTAFTLAKGLL